jgi:hypothetical protein
MAFPIMSLVNLTTAKLEALAALVKKRESLQAELARIEGEIESAAGSSVVVPSEDSPAKVRKTRGKASNAKTAPVEKKLPKVKAPAVKPAKKGKRGALKELILAELKTAGSKGVSVKDLSAKLGVKNQNVHVWFSTTGKTVSGLKKSGPGRWELQA